MFCISGRFMNSTGNPTLQITIYSKKRISFVTPIQNARVAELVDALDSKSSSFESAGSIPAPGT